jgi:hypothetical protein
VKQFASPQPTKELFITFYQWNLPVKALRKTPLPEIFPGHFFEHLLETTILQGFIPNERLWNPQNFLRETM